MNASVQALLRAYGLRPRKRHGQNFLTDLGALERIVAAAELSSEDAVIEVGAGLGTLTRLLSERAGRVLAVELDERLVRVLHERLADRPNVEILHADILEMPDPGFPDSGFKVVGNLPYYITSAVLRRFLGSEHRPKLMVVTVQREVAERLVAGPGQMSLLAVSVQLYGSPRIVARIPPGAFYPPPEVDSAVVRIDVAAQPKVTLAGETGEDAFFRVVRAGFGQKRKTLRNALSGGLGLDPSRVQESLLRAGVDPVRRAETLSLQEWAAVTNAFFAGPASLSVP